MCKKIKSAAVISLIIASISLTALTTFASTELTDIKGHWAKDTIQTLSNDAIISGYSDGTFKPNKTITFAEFLTLTMKTAVGDSWIRKAEPGQHWASGTYQTAVEMGIITKNEFDNSSNTMNGVISREDMALILVRIVEKVQSEKKVDTSQVKGAIADLKAISSDRQEFVLQAYAKGLLAGKGNGFDPKGSLTRAESAAVVQRLLDSSKRVEVKPVEAVEVMAQQGSITIKEGEVSERRAAQEGDIFIKADGTKVVLKMDPATKIVGLGQGVAPDLGRKLTNDYAVRDGHNSGYGDNSVYIVSSYGEGHSTNQWNTIKNAGSPTTPGTAHGQRSDNKAWLWDTKIGGEWVWGGGDTE